MKRSLIVGIFALFIVTTSCITIELTKEQLYRPVKEYALDEEFSFARVFVPVTDSTKIETWHLQREAPRINIVFFNGNGSNIRSAIPMFNALGKYADANVFAANYSGYGRSEGSPSLAGIVNDGRAALESFSAVMDGNLPTYVMGYSLGGFVALHLFENELVDGAVLLSTFTTAKEVEHHVMHEMVPGIARLFLRIKLDSIVYDLNNRVLIEQTPKPVLLIHGENDEFIPSNMSWSLLNASKAGHKEVFLLKEGDHRTVLKEPALTEEAAKAVERFIFP